jgi:predicted nuclease of predicted toxin-antitoxin system
VRFLVDNQLPVELAEWLRQQGHEAEHVLEVQLAQAKDNPIWQHALTHGAVIVSKDEDFAEWVRRGRPGPAVIWLRLGNSTRRELLTWISTRWPRVLIRLQEGARLVEVR